MHKCRVKNINKYGVIKCNARTGRKKRKSTTDGANRKNNGVDFKSTKIKNCIE